MDTRRARVVTPRKRRVWTGGSVDLVLGTAGVPGTSPTPTMNTAFLNKVGRNYTPGDTLAHTWLKGLWSQSAAGDSSKEILSIGVAFMPLLIDAADFPDLFDHDGDLQLHDSRGFLEPTTLQTPMQPIQLATVDIESAGMRTVPSGGGVWTLFCFGQTTNAPSAGSFEFHGAFTQLWLI